MSWSGAEVGVCDTAAAETGRCPRRIPSALAAYRTMSQRAFHVPACIRSHGRLAAIGPADVRRSPHAWSGRGTWSVPSALDARPRLRPWVRSILPGKERSCLDQASARKAVR